MPGTIGNVARQLAPYGKARTDNHKTTGLLRNRADSGRPGPKTEGTRLGKNCIKRLGLPESDDDGLNRSGSKPPNLGQFPSNGIPPVFRHRPTTESISAADTAVEGLPLDKLRAHSRSPGAVRRIPEIRSEKDVGRLAPNSRLILAAHNPKTKTRSNGRMCGRRLA
jgi:hypothetical protein